MQNNNSSTNLDQSIKIEETLSQIEKERVRE